MSVDSLIRGFAVYRCGQERVRLYCLDGPVIRATFNDRIEIPIVGREPLAALWEHESVRRKEQPLDRIEEVPLLYGKYYPGVARPTGGLGSEEKVPDSHANLEFARSVWRELQVLTSDLERCFDVNTLSEANLAAFGTQYEKIIYFACIGVESCLRRVVLGTVPSERRLSMRDYVKVRDALRLNEITIELADYPWFPGIAPFQYWSEENPTSSLGWFDAYNRLKHDKQGNEHLASMENAIKSCAAYYAVAYATYGSDLSPKLFSTHNYFRRAIGPKWRPEDVYYPRPNHQWEPIRLLPEYVSVD